MAANLSVEIGLTGNAVQQAQQITQAFKEMGGAGEAAATSVAGLQAAVSRPTAAPQSNQFTQIVTAMERARVLYAEMASQGAQMGGMFKAGTEQAASYQAAARAAAEVSAALEGALAISKQMIGNNEGLVATFVEMQHQIMELPTGMEKLGAAGKAALSDLASISEEVLTPTKEWQNIDQQIAKDYQLIATEIEKVAVQQDKATAAAAKQQATAQAKTAAKEAADAAAEDAARTKEEAAAQREAAVATREHAEQASKLREMVTGMASMAAGMLGFNVAMEAIEKPISMLKEGMAAGTEEEQLSVKMRDLTGSSVDALAELDKLKEFVAGPLGGTLKLDDVATGVRNLQLLTGESKIDEEQMAMLGATAQVTNQRFSAIATQYGRVVDSIKLGLPVRAQLLVAMQREGLISADNVAKIENLAKKHADHKTILAALDDAMKQNEVTAQQLGDTYEGLGSRLSKTFEQNILAPFGAALEGALKAPMRDLINLFSDPQVTQAIKGLADETETQLALIYMKTKEQGPGEGLIEGLQKAWTAFDGFMQWVEDVFAENLYKALSDSIHKAADDAWKAIQDKWAQFVKAVTPPGAGTQAGVIQGTTQLIGTGAFTPATGADADAINREVAARQQLLSTLEGTDRAEKEVQIAQDDLQNATTKLAIIQNSLAPNEDDLAKATLEVKVAQQELKTATDALKTAHDTATTSVKSLSDDELTAAASLVTFHGDLDLASTAVAQFANAAAVASSDLGSLIGQAKADAEKTQQQIDAAWKPSDAALEVARRQAAAYSLGQVYPAPYTPPKGGGETTGIDPKKAKEATVEFKALDEMIKQIGRDETLTTQQVSLYNAQLKAGMITADQAAKAKDAAYSSEISKIKDVLPQLDQWKSRLEAMAAGYQAIGDEKNYQRVIDEIDKVTDEQAKLNIKTADYLALRQQLGLGNPFQNFMQGVNEAVAAWGTAGQQMIEVGKKITDQLASGFGNALTGLITGTTKLGDAFKQMATAIISDIANMVAKLVIEYVIIQGIEALMGAASGATTLSGAIASGAFKLTGAVPKATAVGATAAVGATSATSVASALPASIPSGVTGVNAVSFGNAIAVGQQYGGLVRGPTGPDQVPSMLTTGEYVLTNRAVDKYGLAMIDAMNRGTFSKFASGGFVGSATSPANIPPSQNATGANTGQNIAIVTNVTVPGSAGTAPGGVAVGGANAGGGGGLSTQDAAQLQQSISMLIRDEIVRQKRPGGLLSKQQIVGS